LQGLFLISPPTFLQLSQKIGLLQNVPIM